MPASAHVAHIAQAQRSSAAIAARVNGIFDVAHAGEYCLASTSEVAAAAAAAAVPVDAAAGLQLVGCMEALLQVTAIDMIMTATMTLSSITKIVFIS
jgi:hypothetical protein